jgi:hypothetical protein
MTQWPQQPHAHIAAGAALCLLPSGGPVNDNPYVMLKTGEWSGPPAGYPTYRPGLPPDAQHRLLLGLETIQPMRGRRLGSQGGAPLTVGARSRLLKPWWWIHGMVLHRPDEWLPWQKALRRGQYHPAAGCHRRPLIEVNLYNQTLTVYENRHWSTAWSRPARAAPTLNPPVPDLPEERAGTMQGAFEADRSDLLSKDCPTMVDQARVSTAPIGTVRLSTHGCVNL